MPDPMTDTPPDVAMARRIVECAVHWSPQTDRDLQSGKNDNTPEMKIALAAIRETTEANAKIADDFELGPFFCPCEQIATAIHASLKGTTDD